MKSEFKGITNSLVKAGLHTYASEVDEALNSRRELKKKAIDLAATIRDSMSASISDKLSSDMVEGAILDVQAVTELVIGELNRIEDKLAKGIWDAMEDAGVSEWAGESSEEDEEIDTIDEDFEEDPDASDEVEDLEEDPEIEEEEVEDADEEVDVEVEDSEEDADEEVEEEPEIEDEEVEDTDEEGPEAILEVQGESVQQVGEGPRSCALGRLGVY